MLGHPVDEALILLLHLLLLLSLTDCIQPSQKLALN